MPAPRFVLDEFWPSDLFLGGIPGAWYDPTDLSTMFQDSTGTTPVTAVEQPVGLILDKSQGLALGAELVTNGTFPVNLNGWTVGDGTPTWVAPGAMRLDSTSARQSAYQDVATVSGVTYEIRVTLSSFTAGGFAPRLTVWSGAFVTNLGALGTSAGTFVGRFRATASTIRLQAYADLGGIANFDDISVRELAGNHASQSTAASRPTYRARYNLLTFSEQFQNAAWTTFGSTSITADATTAPDGTATADKFVAIGAGSIEHLIEQSTPPQAGVYTISAYAKPSEYSWIILKPVHVGDSGSTSQVSFNMSTQTWDASGANRITSYGFQALSNGWFRVFATFSITSACTSLRARYSVSATASPVYVADLTSGAFIWGAQLLTAADVTATGNAYQRIAAATVYDTAPIFRPYLAFDGLDDSLATAAINFTATDKMTVFAGETKLQDATLGVIAELSTDAPGTNGTFWLLAPYTATERYSALSKGTSFTLANSNSALDVSPNTSVLTARLDISAPLTQLSVNRAVRATNTASQGTGNYGNWPLFIGRRNNASFPFNGRLYSLIVRGAASSTTEIADTELWVNARTGAF